MKNKKITGGLGFIGSNLTEKLAQDNEITIIDDQSTGKLANIAHINSNDLTVINAGVTDPGPTDICKDHDCVFHQAALASVPRSIKDPMDSHEANITGTVNVLIAARDAGIKKVICASSSSATATRPHYPNQRICRYILSHRMPSQRLPANSPARSFMKYTASDSFIAIFQ